MQLRFNFASCADWSCLRVREGGNTEIEIKVEIEIGIELEVGIEIEIGIEIDNYRYLERDY